MKKRYLIDTSALLAHLLQESGCEVVEHLLETSGDKLALRILIWVESEIFLNRSAYTAKDSSPLPVDEKVGREALAIREALGTRIPLTDLLIAACAKANDFTLIYRDKDLADIPENLLGQLRLPAKEARTR